MKTTDELERLLEFNKFHPLNFLIPSEIWNMSLQEPDMYLTIQPYETADDGSGMVSMFTFFSESQS